MRCKRCHIRATALLFRSFFCVFALISRYISRHFCCSYAFSCLLQLLIQLSYSIVWISYSCTLFRSPIIVRRRMSEFPSHLSTSIIRRAFYSPAFAHHSAYVHSIHLHLNTELLACRMWWSIMWNACDLYQRSGLLQKNVPNKLHMIANSGLCTQLVHFVLTLHFCKLILHLISWFQKQVCT